MADPHIITTLQAKRDAIEATILAYQGKLDQARRDLAHVSAYTNTSRLFRRGEMVTLCKAALASHGPQDTRELARRVAEAKGMDSADPVLRKALAYRIVQALTLQWKRGGLGSEGIEEA